MIPDVRDLLGRAAIAIALAATVVMTIGYAYVFRAIGTPPAADLATLEVPAAGTAMPILLDEGLPAYVANAGGQAVVLDARAPHPANAAAVLVAWCEREQAFVDLVGERAYDITGRPLSGSGQGLSVYRTRPSGEAGRVIVESSSAMAPGGDPATAREVECEPIDLATHRTDNDQVFDPSVAVDQEPPGWIWLEGTLIAVGTEARLCDGLDGGCDGWAVAGGIDPANLEVTRGRFIGRVRDGAIAGIIIVPALGGSS